MACWVGVLAVGCGGGGQGTSDAGSDVSADVAYEAHIACDFPCFVPWSCSDSTHWVEMQTVVPPYCNSGAMCQSTGVTHACDPGLECVKDAPSGSKAPCAYGGVEGCTFGDAGTLTSDAMAPAPTRQVGVCDQTSIDQFWARCFDPTTRDDASCTYWSNNNKACGTCLEPVLMVAPSEAQLQYPTFVPNVGGCYTLFGDSTCASSADANMQCAMTTCMAGCQDDPVAFSACIQAARTAACSAFSTCGSDAGAFAICEAPSEKDFFSGFGEALCGP